MEHAAEDPSPPRLDSYGLYRTALESAVTEFFVTASGYMRTAMEEEALQIGGASLAAEVAQATLSEDLLLNPEAFKLLQAHDPDPKLAYRVIARAATIQRQEHNPLSKRNICKLGRAMVQGAISILDVFPARRH